MQTMLPQPSLTNSLAVPTAHCRRRLLFLLPFAPRLDGVHGGTRATAQLVAALAERHSVAVLYMRTRDELPADSVLQSKCDLIQEVIRPGASDSAAGTFSQVVKMWFWLLRGRPQWVSEWTVPDFADLVCRVAQDWKPDIVQIEFHMMAQYIPALVDCPAPRVLTQHEPGAQAACEKNQSGHSAGRFLPHLDLLAWRRFERASMKGVDAVVVFTPGDQKHLEPFARRKQIVVIPLGTGIPKHALTPTGCPPSNLLFVGAFRHWPNIDAALRLARFIFPQLLEQFPELRLFIVGESPPRQLLDLANEHIVVTGYVPDVTPFLDRASVVVIPLRYGGGMRVKVLEALAAGKAIVATPLAVGGLDVMDGDQVILAQEDQEFCSVLVRLLTQPDDIAKLATRARAWAGAHLTWDKPVAAYEALYEQLLKQRQYPTARGSNSRRVEEVQPELKMLAGEFGAKKVIKDRKTN